MFIGVAWLAQKVGRPLGGRIVLVAALAFVGVAYNGLVCEGTPWFISSFPLFATGSIAIWTLAGQAHWGLLSTLCVAVVGTTIARAGWSIDPFLGPMTAVAIVAVERLCWDRRFDRLPFRYFAAISYSLYLIHFHIVSVIFRQGTRLTDHSAASGTLWALLAGVVAVGLAHVLWATIERPAMRLSAALRIGIAAAAPIHTVCPV